MMSPKSKSICRSLFLGTGLLVAASVASPALAEDACAGQTWPDLSDDCIDQIVAEVCKAGGGGDSCDEDSSSSGRFVATGKLKAKTPALSMRQSFRRQ